MVVLGSFLTLLLSRDKFYFQGQSCYRVSGSSDQVSCTSSFYYVNVHFNVYLNDPVYGHFNVCPDIVNLFLLKLVQGQYSRKDTGNF